MEEQTMDNTYINNSQYEDIKKQLLGFSKKLSEIQRLNPDSVFFDNQEFIQIMNISKRTAQEWRSQNIISFSQIGKKFYYRMSDIQDMLNKHSIPSIKQ
jgi:hypothetical protein